MIIIMSVLLLTTAIETTLTGSKTKTIISLTGMKGITAMIDTKDKIVEIDMIETKGTTNQKATRNHTITHNTRRTAVTVVVDIAVRKGEREPSSEKINLSVIMIE